MLPRQLAYTNQAQTMIDDETIELHDDNEGTNTKLDEDETEKVSLPAGLTHYYMMVPSKLRLIGLISFILDKLIVS